MKRVHAGLYKAGEWYLENLEVLGLWALYPAALYCTTWATDYGLYQSKADAVAGFDFFTQSEEGQAALGLVYRMTH